jgi:hypothetical protein
MSDPSGGAGQPAIPYNEHVSNRTSVGREGPTHGYAEVRRRHRRKILATPVEAQSTHPRSYVVVILVVVGCRIEDTPKDGTAAKREKKNCLLHPTELFFFFSSVQRGVRPSVRRDESLILHRTVNDARR